MGEPPEVIALVTAVIALIGVGIVQKSGASVEPDNEQELVDLD